ncbi:MAG: Na+/H+ antiporter NhaA, partial [Gemmatimonadota bacterium]
MPHPMRRALGRAERAVRQVIEQAQSSLQDFLNLSASGGIVLMAAAVLAMLVANSPFAPAYNDFLALPVVVTVGGVGVAKPMILWINDGLMAVFFLLIGLELKRELLEGHLASIRQASLPIAAAIGGLIFPALIYVTINRGDAVALGGWAIPAATDIAFALGVLALLGSRVPTALKAFLLSIAILDDLMAIVIIALFYTSSLSTDALIVAGALVAVLALMNRFGVRKSAAYILIGVPLWLAVLKSGVHATLAGVVLAFFIPMGTKHDTQPSPLRDLEHALHPWVAYLVLPIFAFANAGVSLAGLAPHDVLRPVPLGIAAGLFFGKQTGIMTACFLAVRLRIASLGDELRWP